MYNVALQPVNALCMSVQLGILQNCFDTTIPEASKPEPASLHNSTMCLPLIVSVCGGAQVTARRLQPDVWELPYILLKQSVPLNAGHYTLF